MQNLWELDRILQTHLDVCKIYDKFIIFTYGKLVENDKFE
jgi:hypothetical protein